MTTSSTPAWHTSDFPEFRAKRPWVMEEMIEAQPLLPFALAASPAAAEEIAAAVVSAAAMREPIVVTGCGTSEHGAMAIALLIERSLRAAGLPAAVVESRQSFEAALDPRRSGVCIALSHDGSTRATLLALEAAGEAGATTAAITARSESAIGEAADLTLTTPLIDRSWCHTVAYMSAILAGELIACFVAETTYQAQALTDYMGEVQKLKKRCAEMVERLAHPRALVVCGALADRISAREMALKVEEAVRVPSVGYELETVLHGHLAAHHRRDGLTFFVTDPAATPRVARRAGHVAQAASRVGMPVVAVVSRDAAANLPDEIRSVPRVVLPPWKDVPKLAGALAGSALVLQMMTVAIVQEAGVNPDLIRREEKPYREAASVAETDPDW
jgi:glucosamine 6-phosphate synthetase-like amidotransferase/phosphosugar isomerase protein